MVSLSKAYGEAEKESFAHFLQYWDDTTITLVFQGLHHQQFVNVKRALVKGDIVLADRWDEAYQAYHSMYGILSQRPSLREELNDIAFEGMLPDITFLLHVSLEEAERRMQARGKDFFDQKDAEYHSRMAQAYLRLAQTRGWIILDGNKTPTEIHRQILQTVSARIGES